MRGGRGEGGVGNARAGVNAARLPDRKSRRKQSIECHNAYANRNETLYRALMDLIYRRSAPRPLLPRRVDPSGCIARCAMHTVTILPCIIPLPKLETLTIRDPASRPLCDRSGVASRQTRVVYIFFLDIFNYDILYIEY